MPLKLCCVIIGLIFTVSISAQQKPKLVVGLVIDQMRWDYLYRYQDGFSPGGFKRLMNQGHSCENTFIPYLPTYTAPGHACIYSGSVPAHNGIVGNNWFDKRLKRNVYCTEDTAVSSVGTNSRQGNMSPQNLWATTITDELKLSNNFQSKVISIALKDRGAIFTGHSANAAYWYDDTNGNWITSNFYTKSLPRWVDDINRKELPAAFMAKDWNLLNDAGSYLHSASDSAGYEGFIPGESSTSFPHRLSSVGNKKLIAFRNTPYAATYTFDMAKAAIENENLGVNKHPDFLAISISSTDHIGHEFGPNSLEVHDTYLRLDRDIAEFLQFLDLRIGRDNYLLFLTADHAVSHVPAFLQANKIPAGIFNLGNLRKEINEMVEQRFGVKDVVMDLQNYQVYLDEHRIIQQGKNEQLIRHSIIELLEEKPFIVYAFALPLENDLPEPLRTRVVNGYNPKRSGDIQFTLKPNVFDRGSTGTTHGSWNPADAHIPLIWFGWGVKAGKTNRETYMTDIAATLAALLQIQMPNGCVGHVIPEVIK